MANKRRRDARRALAGKGVRRNCRYCKSPIPFKFGHPNKLYCDSGCYSRYHRRSKKKLMHKAVFLALNPGYMKRWKEKHPGYMEKWKAEHPGYFRRKKRESRARKKGRL